MDHDAVACSGRRAQRLHQPVRRAVVIAIQKADMQGIGARHARIPRESQITVLHLKNLVSRAQHRMPAHHAPGVRIGPIKHCNQLHI
ncbi:hypothetical protein D3C84_853860 [compost metagenome]